jgi:hypothetical protein
MADKIALAFMPGVTFNEKISGFSQTKVLIKFG